MRKARAFLLFLALGLAASANAQLFRAYLSASGSDANPCTLVAPCRLLPAALNAVAAGGEIWMLDSANFNSSTVNITKSVSILALPGVVGSVVAVSGTDAITISGAGAKVALRDLVITSNATAPGQSGIVVTNAASLSVDRCLFSGLPKQGIDVETTAVVHVADSLFRNIGTSVIDSGILVNAGGSAEVVDTKFDGFAGFGLYVHSTTAGVTSKASMINSTVTRASNCGVFAEIGNATAGALLHMARSALSNNNGGICVQGGAGAIASLDAVAIHGNVYGVYFTTSSSIVKTFGNNAVSDNGTNMVGGPMTATALQ